MSYIHAIGSPVVDTSFTRFPTGSHLIVIEFSVAMGLAQWMMSNLFDIPLMFPIESNDDLLLGN